MWTERPDHEIGTAPDGADTASVPTPDEQGGNAGRKKFSSGR